MIHGTVQNVLINDMNISDPRELVEIRVCFVCDKAVVPDLLGALADEPYVALLGKDYKIAHEGRYAELRGDAK